MQVLRLRRKLEADPRARRIIQTERGVGYVFALASCLRARRFFHRGFRRQPQQSSMAAIPRRRRIKCPATAGRGAGGSGEIAFGS